MNTSDSKFTNFLLRYINPKKKGFFLECGANDGIAGSPCFELERDYDWIGINVEANKYCYPNLLKNRPKSKNILGALNDYNGHVEFTLPLDGPRRKQAGQSSLIYKHGHWKNHGKIRSTETFIVECFTYDYLIEKIRADRIDLFVLDVEGAEINVLKGMTKVFPVYLCVEDDHFDDHQEDLPFIQEEYLGLIESKGYGFVSKYRNNSLWRLK